MNFIRSPRLLLASLIASIALNTWQFLHSRPAAEDSMRKPVATSQARIESATGPLSGKKAAVAQEDEEDAGPTAESAADIFPPEIQPEDYLIFGGSGIAGLSVTHGEPSGKVSLQRLKEMARMPV